MTAQILGELDVTEEYRAVFDALSAGAPVVFVSGKAGTGKSTLIQWLVEQEKWRTAVVAPTGIAALNINGATLHSFFKFPPRLIQQEDIKAAANKKIYKKIELLIIDEISMVRADLMDAVDWFLQINGPKPGKPFGGVQLLLVGDLFQLPPVVNQEDLRSFFSTVYENPYFFSAKALRSIEITFVELGRIFRQSDPTFAGLLSQIREGLDVDDAIETLNARCFGKTLPLSDAPRVALTPTNRAADARNNRALRLLPGQSRSYAGRFHGVFDAHAQRLPSPEILELKAGAQVMFTRNGKLWVNGTLGIVRELSEKRVTVELAFAAPRKVVEVEPISWESIRYQWDEEKQAIHKEVLGQYTQIPLMLAWATTIHKAQGKTLDAVEIDFERGAFAPGQAYVALSRVRAIEHIALARPIRHGDVGCDPQVTRFYKEFITNGPGDELPARSGFV